MSSLYPIHPSSSRNRVIHLISGLGIGGAERTLQALVPSLADKGIESIIISLSGLGEIGENLRSAGYPVLAQNWNSSRFSVTGFFRLRKVINDLHPAVLQSWMYHADFTGALVSFAVRGYKLFWNIRGTITSLDEFPATTRAVIRACAFLSGRPDGIIANSKQGIADHQAFGYNAKQWILIRNGLDPQRFAPSHSDRVSLRQKLRISENERLIGCLARYHPKKGHEFLIRSFAQLAKKHEDLYLVLVGQKMNETNHTLIEVLRREGVEDRVFLLGSQMQSESIYSALDILAMPSLYGEGFPNVVAEAMSCGIPCVVTDVGDAAHIVGDTGEVVSSGDVHEFSIAMARLLNRVEDDREGLARAARDRIVKSFHINQMVQAYQRLYAPFLGMGNAAKRMQ